MDFGHGRKQKGWGVLGGRWNMLVAMGQRKWDPRFWLDFKGKPIRNQKVLQVGGIPGVTHWVAGTVSASSNLRRMLGQWASRRDPLG